MLGKNLKIISFILFLTFSELILAKSLFLVTLESPPAEFLENSKPVGRNVEIVQEALKRMDYDCIIEIIPWKRALEMVFNGEADGIIDAAYTEERAQYLFYADEDIYSEEWYGFKQKGSTLTFDKDLGNAKNIRLGTSRGFIYGGIIQKAIDEKRFAEIEEVTNYEMNIRKLIGNRIDIIIGVKLTTISVAKEMGLREKIEIVKMTGTNEDYLLSSSKTYLAFSKKTITKEIAEEFSKTIKDMKKDGTFSKIEKKYY